MVVTFVAFIDFYFNMIYNIITNIMIDNINSILNMIYNIITNTVKKTAGFLHNSLYVWYVPQVSNSGFIRTLRLPDYL